MIQPINKALLHNTVELIDAYSKNGCPADCIVDFMVEHIYAALLRGAHPSAGADDAMNAPHEETCEKVANRYAKVIRYGELKKNLPAKFKISPVAIIPHKSPFQFAKLDVKDDFWRLAVSDTDAWNF